MFFMDSNSTSSFYAIKYEILNVVTVKKMQNYPSM